MDGRNTLGRFAAGHRGFKPRGSTSEFQKVTREKLGEFLTERLQDLPSIYDGLEAKEKARFIVQLSEFFLPKQREHYVEIDERQPAVIDYTKLSESALKELLDVTTIIEP